MLTLKEYAKTQNISYEAARGCFRRHQAELSGCYVVENNTTLLTDDGVAKMNAFRVTRRAAVVVSDDMETARLKEELERLRIENRELKTKCDSFQEKEVAYLNALNEAKDKQIALYEQFAAITDKTPKKGLFARLTGR